MLLQGKLCSIIATPSWSTLSTTIETRSDDIILSHSRPFTHKYGKKQNVTCPKLFFEKKFFRCNISGFSILMGRTENYLI